MNRVQQCTSGSYAPLLALLWFSSVSPIQAQCQPSIDPQHGGIPPTSGINFVTIDVDIQSFPDELRDPDTGAVMASDLQAEIQSGVETASETWNSACQGQPANHYPALLPLQESLGLAQASNALIFLGRQEDRTPTFWTDDEDSPILR